MLNIRVVLAARPLVFVQSTNTAMPSHPAMVSIFGPFTHTLGPLCGPFSYDVNDVTVSTAALCGRSAQRTLRLITVVVRVGTLHQIEHEHNDQ